MICDCYYKLQKHYAKKGKNLPGVSVNTDFILKHPPHPETYPDMVIPIIIPLRDDYECIIPSYCPCCGKDIFFQKGAPE